MGHLSSSTRRRGRPAGRADVLASLAARRPVPTSACAAVPATSPPPPPPQPTVGTNRRESRGHTNAALPALQGIPCPLDTSRTLPRTGHLWVRRLTPGLELARVRPMIITPTARRPPDGAGRRPVPAREGLPSGRPGVPAVKGLPACPERSGGRLSRPGAQRQPLTVGRGRLLAPGADQGQGERSEHVYAVASEASPTQEEVRAERAPLTPVSKTPTTRSTRRAEPTRRLGHSPAAVVARGPLAVPGCAIIRSRYAASPLHRDQLRWWVAGGHSRMGPVTPLTGMTRVIDFPAEGSVLTLSRE